MDKSQAMKVMAESHRETVEELEETNKKIIRTANVIDARNQKLLEQNKYYREALLDAREKLNTSLSMGAEAYEAVEIIDKALEDES